ncbi:MAG: hypothetical protein QOI38_285 [Sphingomonadales bacterium]|jgi:hypothetical protein|nr:hypothetical protein [Sphingomonadales bacterium]
MTDRIEALERLQRLRESGALSEEEFAAEKAALLGRAGAVLEEAPPPGIERERVVAVQRRRPEWLIPAALLGVLALFAVVAWLVLRGGGGEETDLSQTNVAAPAAAPPEQNLVEAAPAPTIRDRPEADQLAAAFRAAFGGRATRAVDEADVTFRPGRLVWIGDKAMLVSEGTNAEECHACAGHVAIHRLAVAGDGFRVEGEWLSVATDDYGRPPEWRVTGELTGRPALRVEGGGGNQGIFCNFVSWYDLTGESPRQIARVQTGYTNEGEEGGFELEGRIANLRPGRSFDVVYTGYESFTETYSLRGGRFQFDGAESRVPSC